MHGLGVSMRINSFGNELDLAILIDNSHGWCSDILVAACMVILLYWYWTVGYPMLLPFACWHYVFITVAFIDYPIMFCSLIIKF